jgi:hypothetical protein
MSDPKPIAIVPGHQTVYRVRAVPASSLEPTSFSVSTLTSDSATVTLKGNVKNVPAGTPYKARWLVHVDEESVRRVMIPSPPDLTVSGDSFSVDLKVDAFELELFGKGALGIELAPKFPRCKPAKLEKAISFDNRAWIGLSTNETVADLKIGSVKKFTLTSTGIFDGRRLKLKIYESDSGAGEAVSTKDYARVTYWKNGSGEGTWRVGCHLDDDDDDVVFDFHDEGEVGTYEFGYVISAKPPGSSTYKTVTKNPKWICKVPRPTLESFSLVKKTVDGDFYYDWHTFWTSEKNEKRAVAYSVRGKIKGFTPGLKVQMGASLWVDTGTGNPEAFLNGGCAKAFTLKDDGSFDVQLADFTELAYSLDLTKRSKAWTFFAALRCISAGTKQPFAAVIDYDEAKWLPMAKGLTTGRYRNALTTLSVSADASPNVGAYHEIGQLSRKYECGNKGCGTVSSGKGDAGGASYGTYQMTSKVKQKDGSYKVGGTVKKFVEQDSFPWKSRFTGKTPGSSEFTKEWKALAEDKPVEFQKAQHSFIQAKFYDVQVAKIKKAYPEVDIDVMAPAVQDMVWSTAVQHGKNTSLVIGRLEGMDRTKVATLAFAEELIKKVYGERGRTNATGTLVHFANNSTAVQEGVAKRFVSEQKDALAMLHDKKENTVSPAAPSGDAVAKLEKLIKDGRIIFDNGSTRLKNELLGKSTGKVKISPKLQHLVVTLCGLTTKTIRLSSIIRENDTASHHSTGRALDIGNESIASDLLPKIATNSMVTKHHVDELIFDATIAGETDKQKWNYNEGKRHSYVQSTIKTHRNHVHISVTA